MQQQIIQKVYNHVSVAENQFYRLILVVGNSRTGKTLLLRKLSELRLWPLININLSLSDQLLELNVHQRALKVPFLFDQLIQENRNEVIMLDNTELLFDPLLSQNPLRLLQQISRNQTMIVAWSGDYDGHILTFATRSHPEFRSYNQPESIILKVE